MNLNKYHWIGIISYSILVGIIFLLGYFLTYFIMCHAPQENTARLLQTVKEVCDYTRTSEASEQACIKAQDASNTEYLCKEANTRMDNRCWVEDHKFDN